jgi:hypothetical protein
VISSWLGELLALYIYLLIAYCQQSTTNARNAAEVKCFAKPFIEVRTDELKWWGIRAMK